MWDGERYRFGIGWHRGFWSQKSLAVGSPIPALRKLREGRGTHSVVVSAKSKGRATRRLRYALRISTDFPILVDSGHDKPVPHGIAVALGGELVLSRNCPGLIDACRNRAADDKTGTGNSIVADVPSGRLRNPSFLP